MNWPRNVPRIPDDPWTRQPVDDLAEKYDAVKRHSWYRNLDRSVEQLVAFLEPGAMLLDYSCGTGILIERLLARSPGMQAGVLLVDASAKFMRLALEKFCADPRIGLRHLRYLKQAGRLERLQEALEPELLERGFEALASTNAIHLYYDLEETLAAWRQVLVPGGRAFIQSGNIGGDIPEGHFIIDQTVELIHREAVRLVEADSGFACFRPALTNQAHMEAHARLRRKYFLPVRPLEHYLEALQAAGFEVLEVERRPIGAQVDEWCAFLAVYHEGVLGWAGGAERITGEAAPEETVAARLTLLEAATQRVFGGRETFEACWTYLTATPADG